MSCTNLSGDGIYYLNEFVKCFYQIKRKNRKKKQKWSKFSRSLQSLAYKQMISTEAVAEKCSVKKVFLLKKRFWHRCFPVNFVKSVQTPFFTEHLR